MIVNKPKKKKKISRYSVLYIIMFIIMGTILAKLLYLQVYKHDDYKEKADVSSTKFISEEAPRGNIYDADGNIIATNKQTYALTYMETVESTKAFYKTMDKMFEILEENGEEFQDDLALKVDESGNIYFEFKADSESAKRTLEVRFKRDRGLNEDIETELFEDQEGDYTDEQINEVNDKLMEISAEDTFYYLVKSYDLYKLLLPDGYTTEQANELAKKYKDATGKEILDDLLKEYTIQEIRRYIVIKDAVKIGSFSGYSNITIANNINRDTAFIVYQQLNDLPGINVTLKPVRYYPYGTLASAVVGYVSSISSSQSESYELRGYDVSSDLIGVSGIESAFEDQLKGTKGGTTVKVNSQGRTTEELFKLESYQGNNVHLTIDKDVQYAAEQAMKDTLERLQRSIAPNATRGAVVVVEVKTGRIIAMVSYPDYDPNIFSIPGKLTEEEYQKYFDPDIDTFAKEYMQRTGATGNIDDLFPIDEDTGERTDGIDAYPKNFFNYATQGLLPPGSTFKPLTAVAALMEGVTTTGESLNDTNGTWSKEDLPGMILENFQRVANGYTDLRYALQVSSNFYFYEMGYRLYKNNGGDIAALDSLAYYAWKFGLGVDPNSEDANNLSKLSTGIQIEENFGQVYNFESWKKQIINTPMYEIVEALQKGSYYSFSFIPLNIEDNEEDLDTLKEAKTNLKEKMKDALKKVGTDEQITDNTEFSESLVPYVKKVMELSDQYKASVKDASTRRNVDIDDEAGVISDAIAYYIINNLTVQIKTPGQIISSAIGQGMNNFTPLQIANYVATLANGGTRYKLTLVDKITSPTGEIIKEYTPEVVDQLDIPESYLQAIKDGMYRVNTSPANGMAYESFANFPIKVGGKTGTADFSTDEQYTIQGRKAYGNYISMAPLDDPEIAIFSTIYDGSKGSEGAAIHKAIYEAYFKDELLEMDSSYASRSESFRKYVLESPLKDNKDDSIKIEEATDLTTETTP